MNNDLLIETAIFVATTKYTAHERLELVEVLTTLIEAKPTKEPK